MQSLREAIHGAESRRVAVGHFNISEFAALHAITKAARELGVPVIIGTSEGESAFIGVKESAELVRITREKLDHPIYLNADHLRDRANIKAVAEAGYDSMIFDGAALPLEENIAETKRAVHEAKSINPDILVEGEVGYIGTSSKLLDAVPEGAAIRAEDMTTPEEARQFVEETGVDLLAPAVGEIHGMMKNAKHPNLDIDRIRAIREAVGVPLVLHGGSGVSDEDFAAAIEAGISIAHINTEIRIAWRRGLEEMLAEDKDQVAPYKILSDPKDKTPSDPEEQIYRVVLKRLRLFNRLQ